MQAVFVHEGNAIDYTPLADVAAGAVVVQGSLVGITKQPIPANILGSLSIRGIFDVVKAALEILARGTPIYWDADGDPVGGVAGTGAATTVAAGNVFMGYSTGTAAIDGETVQISLASSGEPQLAIALGDLTDLAVPDAESLTFGTSTLTRAGNNIVAALPVADPAVAGALWNDAGVVKVSAG